MGSSKKAVDLDGYFTRNRELFNGGAPNAKLSKRGIGGDAIIEPVPEFIEAPCETVMQGQNNSYIVLGRDRPASRLSGYGGKGDTGASMIDMCVGRMAWEPKSQDDQGNVVHADPNFEVDAARIYISQKTDIDDNLKIVDGTVGNSKAKSAIGIKADALRFVAREGIKIVTRTDEKNSQGAEVKDISGIDLIAGNDDEKLQPIPVGDNLKECLDRIIFHIDKLNGIVDSFLMQQIQFNTALTSHTHLVPIIEMTLVSPPVVSAGMSTVTKLATSCKIDLAKHKANLKLCQKTYLTKAGAKYINSRYNKVN
jgi:hypothetical protein